MGMSRGIVCFIIIHYVMQIKSTDSFINSIISTFDITA